MEAVEMTQALGNGRRSHATRIDVPLGVLALSASFAVAACGGAATPGASPDGAPSAGTSGVPATDGSTPALASQAPPATQAAAPEICTPTDAPECLVPAGTYHAVGFDGGMTFRIHGDVWTQAAYQTEMLSLHIGPEWVVFMSGPVNVVSNDGAKTTSDVGMVRRVVADRRGLEVTVVDEAIQIDGTETVVFEIANTGKKPLTLWNVAESSAIYSLNPGVSVRMHWLDRNGTPFILALEAPAERLPIVVEDAAVVINSIVFD
jgi:hypothetical protein